LRLVSAVIIVLYPCFFFGGLWQWYSSNVSAVTPIGTFIGAAVIAWAALTQSRTARLRHEEQTKADLQRRITESFSKACEQLGSDKLAVRLGGIYTLERISLESWKDYWPVMETLSAFVRERSLETEQKDPHIATDVAAVMTLITRRSDAAKTYEADNSLHFDLSNSDLRGAQLYHLELVSALMTGVNFQGAHLLHCDLSRSRLQRANLRHGHFDHVQIYSADLTGANMSGSRWHACSLNETYLRRTDLTKASISASIFEYPMDGASMDGAIVNGADLRGAVTKDEVTTGDFFKEAVGDEWTVLPEISTRPELWPAENPRAREIADNLYPREFLKSGLSN
jgi:hypothetical protein